MPNIISDLTSEMTRVRRLVADFDPIRREDAMKALRYASDSMAMNSLDSMIDALNDLKGFTEDQKQ
jgi:uncharacterized protein (DUF433 family)